jgi:hypothetical protein
MKRKMDGTIDASQDEQCFVDENVRKLGNKLKHGNALDVGQRGCNKVSAMAEQLIHKLERPKQTDSAQIKQTVIFYSYIFYTFFYYSIFDTFYRPRAQFSNCLKKDEPICVTFAKSESTS